MLPAGERVLAQQEGHVHRQEAREHPQPGVAPQREDHVGGHPELLLVAAQADRQLAARRRRPWPAAGSRGSSRRRTPRTRSAATTASRTSRPARPAGAEIAAPTTPASEIRLLALTRVSPLGCRRGTVAARATPYALDETSTPERGRVHRHRLGRDGVGHQPAQERAQRHRAADRPAAAVAEPVEERARAAARRPRTAASSGRGRARPGRAPRRAGRRTACRPARSRRRRHRRR